VRGDTGCVADSSQQLAPHEVRESQFTVATDIPARSTRFPLIRLGRQSPGNLTAFSRACSAPPISTTPQRC